MVWRPPLDDTGASRRHNKAFRRRCPKREEKNRMQRLESKDSSYRRGCCCRRCRRLHDDDLDSDSVSWLQQARWMMKQKAALRSLCLEKEAMDRDVSGFGKAIGIMESSFGGMMSFGLGYPDMQHIVHSQFSYLYILYCVFVLRVYDYSILVLISRSNSILNKVPPRRSKVVYIADSSSSGSRML